MKRLTTLLLIATVFFSCKNEPINTRIAGQTFGTKYSVIYDLDEDFEIQFDSIFMVINRSMSTYIKTSDLAKINNNEAFNIDENFKKVLAKSKEVYRNTQGFFDPTIGAVVNAWSFGPEGTIKNLDSAKVEILMKTVGLNKVGIKGNNLYKQNPETRIDFNAVAKGYAIDVLGEFLESKGSNNYLVEIGGEVRCKGSNIERKNSSGWNVGLDRPRFDGIQDVNPLRVIVLKNESMATSGTYRKFKIDKDGKRYTHIINTKTGYPSKTNLLSVSVIAQDCMTADAYATAFQAMGLDKIKVFLDKHPEIKAFVVYENDKREFEMLSFNNFPE